jgi:CheY-like chemotaxis protein
VNLSGAMPRPLRVVVADDQPDTVLTLVELLREGGHQVRGVHNASEVVDVVRDFDPDAVLLDLSMPDQDGCSIAREIRQRGGSARPILIAISGVHKDAVHRIMCKIAGFNYHLEKPCDPAVVMEILAAPRPD